MKRIFSFALVCLLMLHVMPTSLFANSSPITVDVYVNDSTAAYGYSTSDYTVSFSVDLSSGQGEMALIPASTPAMMYTHTFAVAPEEISPSSYNFWNSVKELCFSQTSAWESIDAPTSVVTPINTYALNSDHCDITRFESYLTTKYGADYDRVVSNRVIQGVPFTMRESLECWVQHSITTYADAGMTVVQVATAVFNALELINKKANPAYSAIYGKLADLGEYILLYGAQIVTYDLIVDHYRYVVHPSNQTAAYVVADYFTYETAMYYREPGEEYKTFTIAQLDAKHILYENPESEYIPSQTLFDSADALYNAAYNEYLIYGIF